MCKKKPIRIDVPPQKITIQHQPQPVPQVAQAAAVQSQPMVMMPMAAAGMAAPAGRARPGLTIDFFRMPIPFIRLIAVPDAAPQMAAMPVSMMQTTSMVAAQPAAMTFAQPAVSMVAAQPAAVAYHPGVSMVAAHPGVSMVAAQPAGVAFAHPGVAMAHPGVATHQDFQVISSNRNPTRDPTVEELTRQLMMLESMLQRSGGGASTSSLKDCLPR